MAHPALGKQDHRPWPIPSGRWKWRQSWCDLLFAHWPIPAAVLRPLVPDPLEIQEFDGTSWVGIVPFRMEGVMRRPWPALPWISAFPELNVRLYVEHEGKRGVWFLSLDATNPLAVWAAKRFVYLPYRKANMYIKRNGGGFSYYSERIHRHPDITFEGTYQPASEVYQAEPGTLEHWLTERYCLYAQDTNGDLYRSEVHHKPWPLQKAEADIQTNELLDPFGIELPDEEPLLHFAQQLDVIIWSAERITD